MAEERLPPDSPEEWLNRARSDLKIAKTAIEGVYLEDLCYHAQQAAEKALKGCLLKTGSDVPYVHSLSQLVSRLEGTRLAVPQDVRECVGLTEYAVSTRYPGFDEPVTENEWKMAVKQAEVVVKWVASQVG